ncbi:RNA polymerase sigma factor [Metabacillus sp. RGM 3146]|uniref:RNA polymerase sigma factor n=1 Tax=Metabacillus sp. RGM 3146 TaxID=3401092 RepID=UPI003B9A32DD
MLKQPLTKAENTTHADNQFEAKYASLFKYCMLLTRNKCEAEDLMQDTWLKAIETYGNLESAPLALLSKIAYNKRIDQFRKTRLTKTPLIEEVFSDDIKNMEKALMAAELLADHLTAKQATILLLKEALLYKTEEIAKLTGYTQETVKSLLYRGRQRLKKRNDQPEEEDFSRNKENLEEWKEALAEALTLEDPSKILSLLYKETKQPVMLSHYRAANGRYPSAPTMKMAA